MSKLQLATIIIALTLSYSIKSENLTVNIETKINTITKWYECGDHIKITASPSGSFITGSEKVAPEFWESAEGEKVNHERMDVSTMESAFHEKKYVVIEFDTDNKKIKATYFPIIDSIAVLGDPNEDSDEIMVHALKRPSLYYLKKNHKNFNHIYSVLSEAHNRLKEGVEAAVAVSPGAYFVEDAIIVKRTKDK